MTTVVAEWTPTIDVLVAAYNEERYILRCLDSVLAQDYPRERVRVLVLDGGSSDRTVPLVKGRAQTEPRLTVLTSAQRQNLGAALNIGVSQSSAELVAKVDAHGYVEPDFLRWAVEAFRCSEADVACVGGSFEQEGDTPFGRAVALARTSKFGVGDSVYAETRPRRFVDSVSCGIYGRARLLAVGGFDPDFNCGEDNELNCRLRQAGYRILLDRKIRFHYVARPAWLGVYRQYRSYGRAKIRILRLHPEFVRLRHLLPAAFFSTLGLLGLCALFLPIAGRGLAALGVLYVLAASGVSLRAARWHEFRLAGRMATAFVALHLGYAVGSLPGVPALVAAVARRNTTCRGRQLRGAR